MHEVIVKEIVKVEEIVKCINNYIFPCLIPDAENQPSMGEEFGSFEIPPNISEDSMENAIPPDNIVPNYQLHPVKFEIVTSSSQRGKQKLVDSRGFSYYTVKRKCKNGNVFWRCTVRNKTTSCLATVRQQQTVFILGPHDHCHQPVPGVGIAAKITREVKAKAMENYFQSAGAIVEQAHPCGYKSFHK